MCIFLQKVYKRGEWIICVLKNMSIFSKQLSMAVETGFYKVSGPNLVTYFNRTPLLESGLVRCRSKNGPQKKELDYMLRIC